MSEAGIIFLVFGGFFILRILAAVLVFALLLPRGDRCLNCDTPTVRVASVVWDRLLPAFRKSWCLRCGWIGLLRRGPVSIAAELPKEAVGRR